MDLAYTLLAVVFYLLSGRLSSALAAAGRRLQAAIEHETDVV